MKSTCHVLVVEDDAAAREVLAALLTDSGFEVTMAATAAEAWAHLRNGRRPNVIVLDLILPDMDGWDFSAPLKRDPDLSAIPIVAVSGAGTLIDAARSLRKPLDADELAGILADLC
ncbi:MAG: response regulator [Vicinamibacterales bacterium]